MLEHRKKIITEKCENPMVFKWDFKRLGGPRKSHFIRSFMVDSFSSRILTIRGGGSANIRTLENKEHPNIYIPNIVRSEALEYSFEFLGAKE